MKGLSAFFAELGGHIVVIYCICWALASLFAGRMTWINSAHSFLVRSLFKIEYTHGAHYGDNSQA